MPNRQVDEHACTIKRSKPKIDDEILELRKGLGQRGLHGQPQLFKQTPVFRFHVKLNEKAKKLCVEPQSCHIHGLVEQLRVNLVNDVRRSFFKFDGLLNNAHMSDSEHFILHDRQNVGRENRRRAFVPLLLWD